MQKNKENKGIIIKIITGILVVLCIILCNHYNKKSKL